MTALPVVDPRGVDPRVRDLQQRVQRMQGAAVTRTLASLPGLAGVVTLKTGCAYAVDSPSLVMALMAGPSAAGEWIGVVGAKDFGLEAAAAFGVDLERTVVVPDPGEHWLSVTAGLAEVAGLVVVRTSQRVTEHQAARLRARLRTKDAALISWGDWPGAEATLSVTGSRWVGLGQGHGHLQGRRVVVTVRQSGPVRRVPLWLPGVDQHVSEGGLAETTLSLVERGLSA